MKKMSESSSIYKDLQLKSTNYLNKMLKVMKYIDENKEEIVNEITSISEYQETEKIVEWLEREPFDMIVDSKKIIKEIDLFVENAQLGPEKLEKNRESYIFLASAYYGDMYDEIYELDAFRELVKELNISIKNANIDYITELGIEYFSALALKNNKK